MVDAAELRSEIERANRQQASCEGHGDRDGSEAWHGYVRALRWVEYRMGLGPHAVPPAKPPIVGGLVRIHHDHPFAGLCVGEVVEARPGRLTVEVRAPDYRGPRQDFLAIPPGQATPIEVATAADRADELARLRKALAAARTFIDQDRRNFRGIVDSVTDPAFRAMERAVEACERDSG